MIYLCSKYVKNCNICIINGVPRMAFALQFFLLFFDGIGGVMGFNVKTKARIPVLD